MIQADKLYVNYEKYSLENGLKVILSENNSIPSAAINLCYKVGSKDEDENKRGFAHLFEHLMFEGSLNVPKGEYDRYCVSAGGENNAYTNEDKTNYYIILPSSRIELGLWLESDRMLEFTLNEKSLELQKEVVIEEKKQIFDNKPYGSVALEFPPRLYKSGGYSWDTIGETADIEAATIEDVRKFFYNYYVPNNTVLSISGQFDKDRLKNNIEKYFGDIKPGNINRKPQPVNNFNTGEISDVIYDNIQFPGIFFGYRIPGENTPEHYIFEIISAVLATGESSRFYNKLVYEKQLVSDIGCYADVKEFAGTFYIYSILMPGVKTEDVEYEIDKIIIEIIEKGITDSELIKVKNRIETNLTYRLQTNINKADMLAHYESLYGDAGIINTLIDKYIEITPGKIMECAEKYISRNNRVVLKYMPRNKSK